MRDARYLTVTSRAPTPSEAPSGRTSPPCGFLLQTLGAIDLVGPDGERRRAVLAQPKRLALLVYLGARDGRSFVRRDALLSLFWPEHDETGARAALRQAIHFLRSALGAPIIMRRGDDEVAIAPGELSLDAVRFATAVREGRAEDALALYRGDFLEGFLLSGVAPELEEWIETERTALRARAIGAALSLARREEANRRLESATRWARRAAALAPYDESAQRLLITLLDAGGDQGAALHTYNAFRHRLVRELEVEPSVQTRALVSAIRARSAATEAVAVAPPYARGPAGVAIDSARATSSLSVLPFRFDGPAENTFLGVSIAEEIRDALHAVEGLTIASRIESEAWREHDHEALRRLGVDTVLSGEIRQDDARVRISARLLSLADNRELWHETYERNSVDLFSVVRRLVQAIVGALRIALAADRTTHLVRPPTTDMEAYRL